MTETEWLSCDDVKTMLAYLETRSTDRKMRRFSLACCHRVLPRPVEPRVHKALELAEFTADSGGHSKELRRASNDLRAYRVELERAHGEFGYLDFYWPAGIVQCLYGENGLAQVQRSRWVAELIIEYVQESSISEFVEHDVEAEHVALCELIRDIFGNPFRPVTFAPEWRTETAVALAQTMYDDRDFGNLPILADALQDAGCEHVDVLDHCRGPGPHVRGCWVVDLVLGKN